MNASVRRTIRSLIRLARWQRAHGYADAVTRSLIASLLAYR